MNEPDGTFPRSITVRRAWLLVGFMWVAYLLNYTDRSLFLTNLAAIVPVDTHASAVGVLNFIGALVAGFAALLGGVWKQTLGIHNLMTCGALATVLGGLFLVYSIWQHFQEDYARVH